LSADSTADHLNQTTLNPMVALGYFITNHPPRQIPPQYEADPTLTMLYSIARRILSKEEFTKAEKVDLISQLEKVKRDFETILDEYGSQSSNENRTRQSAEDGINLIVTVQKDLEGGGDEPHRHRHPCHPSQVKNDQIEVL
jgi:hypothetical protein